MLVGCASGSPFTGKIALASDDQLVVVRAFARLKKNGVLVGGDVRRPNFHAGVVPGHLHVEGRDRNGQIIVSAEAPWGEFKTRRFRLAYFRAFLEVENPADLAAISVTRASDTQ